MVSIEGQCARGGQLSCVCAKFRFQLLDGSMAPVEGTASAWQHGGYATMTEMLHDETLG